MIAILVGVDHLQAYTPVVALIKRLRFEDAHLTLVHAASNLFAFVPLSGDREEIGERYAHLTTSRGEFALHEAVTSVKAEGLCCDAHLTFGHASERLIREAEARHSDLVAVNTKPRGASRSNSIGSVGRALALGSHTSVLATKGEVREPKGALTAVFATDHSPFADRCLDRFLQLAPQGLAEILVVSAWEIDDAEAMVLGQNLAMLGGDVERYIESAVEERNAIVCGRLEAAGYRTRSVVRAGKPNDVLHVEMVGHDLLILGAQGHGTMALGLLGSVALHQMTGEDYPVLILHPLSH